jgi:hypothetical protein
MKNKMTRENKFKKCIKDFIDATWYLEGELPIDLIEAIRQGKELLKGD